MTSKEIRDEFFRNTRRTNRVPEVIPPEDSMEMVCRKLRTVVISDGPRHVLRRTRVALNMS